MKELRFTHPTNAKETHMTVKQKQCLLAWAITPAPLTAVTVIA